MTDPFLHPQEILIDDIARLSSTLSICGSIYVLFTWFLFTDLHFFSRKLIVYIAIADLGSAIAFISGTYIGAYPEGKSAPLPCIIQGVALQYFYLSSYIWTGCLSVYLYQILVKKANKNHNFEVLYHFVGWGIPFAICAYLVYEEVYGSDKVFGGAQQAWCWIDSHAPKKQELSSNGISRQFAFFYTPQAIVFIMNAYNYSVLINGIKGSILGEKLRKRLLWYLLSFLCVAIWGMLHRTYQVLISDHRPNLYLSILESFFSPLQGFLNAIVYSTSKTICSKYAHVCTRGAKYQHPLVSNTLNETNDSSMDLGYVKDSPDGAIPNNESFSPLDKGSPPLLTSATKIVGNDTFYMPLIDPVASRSSGHTLGRPVDFGLDVNTVEGHSFAYIPRRMSPSRESRS